MGKKLKGLAKIELTNVRTGETKVQYEENIVTNAIPNIYGTNPFGACFVHAAPSELMGGLLLFKNKDGLMEDVNNTVIPRTPDAWAGNGVSKGLSTKRGNAVLQESVVTPNGCKLVWEFGTAQANGSYESLCLTNPYICNNDVFGIAADSDENPISYCMNLPLSVYENTFTGMGIEIPNGGTLSAGAVTAVLPFCIDYKNGYFYSLKYDPASTKELTIRRCTRKANSIPIGQTSNGDDTDEVYLARKGAFYNDLISVNVTLQNPLSTNTGTKVSSVHYVEDLNKLYIFTLTNNTNTIYQTIIDLNTFTANGVEVSESVLTYNDTKYWVNRSTNSDFRGSLCTNKVGFKYPYVYLPKYNETNTIYKLNINDTSDIKTLNGSAALVSNSNAFNVGDTLTFGNFIISPGYYIIDTATDTVSGGPVENALTHNLGTTSVTSPPIVMGNNYFINKWSYSVYSNYRFHKNGYCYGYSVFLNPFYLATINNVTAFTKTSSDVMRITYTITEVDS